MAGSQYIKVTSHDNLIDSDVMVGDKFLKLFEGLSVIYCMGTLIDGRLSVGERIYGVYDF